MIKEFFCEIFFSCAVATASPLTVDELMHRSVLFDAYQSDYSAAFVKALAMEEAGMLDKDDTDFALTKASLAVQQGLFGYASQTFAAIENRPLTEGDRLRLSLEKARLHHQRGDLAALKQELAIIDSMGDGHSAATNHPELLYLQADLLLQQQRFKQAGALIENLRHDEPYRAYALFNMAMALREAERGSDAWDVLELLLAMPGDRAEVRDLRDRGRLAMAHLSGELNRADDAAPLLEDLPADSRYRPAALMAYGTHALRQGDNALAARVFGSVVRDEPWLTSASYAQVALPIALQGMTEPALVLDQFRMAQSRLERRAAVLAQVQKQLLDRAFVADLLRSLTSNTDNELKSNRSTAAWRGELSGREWLDWLAADELAAPIAAWRDYITLVQFAESVPARLDKLAEKPGSEAAQSELRARAVTLRQHLNAAIQNQEDNIAALLAARLKHEMERVDDYLLTADLALARASDQVAGYSREAPPKRPRAADLLDREPVPSDVLPHEQAAGEGQDE